MDSDFEAHVTHTLLVFLDEFTAFLFPVYHDAESAKAK